MFLCEWLDFANAPHGHSDTRHRYVSFNTSCSTGLTLNLYEVAIVKYDHTWNKMENNRSTAVRKMTYHDENTKINTNCQILAQIWPNQASNGSTIVSDYSTISIKYTGKSETKSQ